MIDNRNQIKQRPGQHSTEDFILFPPRSCSGPGCPGFGGPGPCKGAGCRGNRW